MTFLDKIKNEIADKQPKNLDVKFVTEAVLTRAHGGFTSGYHFEFVYGSINEARGLCDMLAQYDIFAKLTTTVKNDAYRVYIKNSDCICNLLALVGANKCLLELHNEIALRSVRNTSNRRANCDSANIEKQISAASVQILSIEKLKQSGELERLSHELYETAIARLENPDATYEELAKILGITKSGIVHRLRRLLS